MANASKVYEYPSGDPRRPFAVGYKVGQMGFQFTTGSPERAAEVADGLRSGTLNPRQVV